MKFLPALFFFVFISTVHAQKKTAGVELLTSGVKNHFRGLSVVNDNIAWVSGTKGVVGKTTDGGKNWKWFTVTGFNKDFRDIEAFDATTAIVMSVDTPAYLLKTVDGGETWKVVYENRSPGMFLDAMEFWNPESGIVIGDPIDNHFFILRTFDGGDKWMEIPFDKRPVADSGEACFAASGTNIKALDKDEAVFVSGGRRSRMFTRDNKIEFPLIQGEQTTGANSIAVFDHRKMKGGKILFVVGGDFNKPASTEKNAAYSTDGGRHWQIPATLPHGYRSCVEFISKKDIITCGLNGVDLSTDQGKNFNLISNEGFHVCRKAKDGKAVFFAGANGKLGKLVWK